ncbi:unnamed protein product [Pedinophyceae sp. YPF-701]|nr:unnamed protein product [Pedinophyceae sp. YPF-701]
MAAQDTPASSPFEALINVVPAVLDALPAEAVRNVAATSWACLIIALRHTPLEVHVRPLPETQLLAGIARRTERWTHAVGTIVFTIPMSFVSWVTMGVAASEAGRVHEDWTGACEDAGCGCGEEGCCADTLKHSMAGRLFQDGCNWDPPPLRSLSLVGDMFADASAVAREILNKGPRTPHHHLADLCFLRLAVTGAGDVEPLPRDIASAANLRVLHLDTFWALSDCLDALIDVLRALPHLEELRIEPRGIMRSKGVAALFDHVATNGTIVDLTVLGVRVGEEGGEAMKRALRENTTLRRLRLRENLPDADPWEMETQLLLGSALGAALPGNSTLEELSLEGSDLGEHEGELLRGVAGSTSLRVMNLRGCKIRDSTEVTASFRAIAKGGIRRLLLGGNMLVDTVGNHIPEALMESSQLEELEFSTQDCVNTRLPPLCVCDSLVCALRDGALGRTLQVLVLRGVTVVCNGGDDGYWGEAYDEFGLPDGGMCLLMALKHCAALRTLDLSYCALSDDALGLVPAVLQCSPRLRQLSLRGCGIDDEKVRWLCDWSADYKALESLDLGENNIKDVFKFVGSLCYEDPNVFPSFKERPCGLKHLDLSRQTYLDAEEGKIELLARVVRSGALPLETLDLSRNCYVTWEQIRVVLGGMFKSKPARTITLRATVDDPTDAFDLGAWYQKRRLARREGQSIVHFEMTRQQRHA